MTATLGAEETLKGIFVSFMQANRGVTLELLRGDPITGIVVGEPTDEFVVIQRQMPSDSGTLVWKQFLIRYAAILTITEGPVQHEERAAV